MLFFIVCACFALYPELVLNGAQNGLALCINAVIPSLLPFMVVSACIIKSGFSEPLGTALSKVLTPITGISRSGSVCLVTGLLGGYGAGARAVLESYKTGRITKKEAERLLPICNNAGPLFVIGTVGVGFFADKNIGIMLFAVQLLTSLITARLFSGDFRGERPKLSESWVLYKKNKPPVGGLITKAAIESGSAIVTASVFVITFSAILEILPFGSYSLLSGILEVTRGVAEMSRHGKDALPWISALLSWGGMSVHLQANALCEGKFGMRIYYIGKLVGGVIAFFITKLLFTDKYTVLFAATVICAAGLCAFVISRLFSLKYIRQHGFRQQRHS